MLAQDQPKSQRGTTLYCTWADSSGRHYVMTKSAPVHVYAVQQFLFAFGLHKGTLYRTA